MRSWNGVATIPFALVGLYAQALHAKGEAPNLLHTYIYRPTWLPGYTPLGRHAGNTENNSLPLSPARVTSQ
ncbi:hypothetical protein F4779DRAFT_584896 [Xylariaceae sp. FL0662B]|nr:hypothetical protein F4779DRAFT_584896 [Xylariaceae sp. FL0662B]